MKTNDVTEGVIGRVKDHVLGITRSDLETEVRELANSSFRQQQILQSELKRNNVKRIYQLSNKKLRELYNRLKDADTVDTSESIEQAIDSLVEN